MTAQTLVAEPTRITTIAEGIYTILNAVPGRGLKVVVVGVIILRLLSSPCTRQAFPYLPFADPRVPGF